MIDAERIGNRLTKAEIVALMKRCLRNRPPMRVGFGRFTRKRKDKLVAIQTLWLDCPEEFTKAMEMWRQLLFVLDLPHEYCGPVLQALRKSGWRTANQPRAYLRRAATFIGRDRFGMATTAWGAVKPHGTRGYDGEARTGIYKFQGVWHAVSGTIYAYDWGRRRDIPDGLEADPGTLSWPAVGAAFKKNNLSSEHFVSFSLRMQGMTRKEIVAMGRTERDRKKLRATYDDLTRKMDFVREIFGRRGKTKPSGRK